MHRSTYLTLISHRFWNVLEPVSLLTSREIRSRRKGELAVSPRGYRLQLVAPQPLGEHEVRVAQLLFRGRRSLKSSQKRHGCLMGCVQLSGHGHHWAPAMRPRQRVYLQRCQ